MLKARVIDVRKTDRVDDELYEFYHNLKRYVVKKSELGIDWEKKVIVLPDGTILEARQMFVDYSNKQGSPLKVPRLMGKNREFRVWGCLPVLNRVEAKEQKE